MIFMYIRKFLFLTVSQDSFLTRNANHQCSISKCAEENRPYEVVIVLRLRSGGALYYAAILRKREYSKNRIRKKWWFHDVWWMVYCLPQLSISIIVLLNFSWSCHTLKCRKLVVKDALKLLWHFHHLRSIFHVSPSSTFSFQQRSTSQIPTCKPCGFPNAFVGFFKWKKHLNQGFNIQKNLQLGSTPPPHNAIVGILRVYNGL